MQIISRPRNELIETCVLTREFINATITPCIMYSAFFFRYGMNDKMIIAKYYYNYINYIIKDNIDKINKVQM